MRFQAPWDWAALLAFLAHRAIPGVEKVTANSYARHFVLDGVSGHVLAQFRSGSEVIDITLHYPATQPPAPVIERLCGLFDLRADSSTIDQHLGRDELLRPMVQQFPGLRVPGCWNGFELAVRAVLGQQVTVKAATTLITRLVERHGTATDRDREAGHTFPAAAVLAEADLSGLGIVGQRIAAIQAIARLVCAGELPMDGTVDTREFVARICRIKGIGQWTAQYIAMRALRDPNAFPDGDLILRRAAASPGQTLRPKQLLQRAECWQPWRAYAAMLLWRYHQFQQQ